MNVILRKTHIPKHIELLKARDYYFDVAKNLNLFKTIIVVMPSLLLLATYLLSLVGVELFSGWQEEIFIGAFTTIVAFAVHIVDIFIHKYTGISNRLRALYDHEVLEVSCDPTIECMDRMETYLEKAKKIPYSFKYEVWYSEVFSSEHTANVFCCQMDNLLYAKHAYKKAQRLYWTWLGLLIAVTVFAVVCAGIAGAWITMFLTLFSVLECYDVCIGKLRTLKEAQEICVNFCQYAEGLQPQDLTKEIIEKAQDTVNRNRDQCIFLPRVIRKQFLKAGNSFYVELDQYKAKFMGDEATIPENAESIEVVFEDGSDAIPLQDIQNRLAAMLQKVVRVLDEAGVTYTLDGGTLIGAKRLSTKGFIPWDDDIDLAIPVHQLEQAKKVLREQLDYVIQDADSELYYSPRLSAFKIREQNEDSQIAEKDSQLWTEYAHHGLFIDVYAMSPILISKRVDALFRRLWIHPINRRLERVENGKPHRRRNVRFQRLKRRYCRRLDFYAKHAKNSRYYAYFPGYIYDRKRPGPYHAAAELYGEPSCSAEWEKDTYRVPTNPHAVLSAYYGADWAISPYRSKKELVAKYGDKWYSQAPINVTALKHVAYILSYSR